ncbi:MAG TPA: ankyrin repeat domain-containing protein, partial [Candidatus Wallbacteria bacterium]|nr:ankyrin repeat domain-containing protein [Candidatus Wallbacteria bacterium]
MKPDMPNPGSRIVLAAAAADVKAVMALIEAGTDIDSKDAGGRTALIAATVQTAAAALKAA